MRAIAVVAVAVVLAAGCHAPRSHMTPPTTHTEGPYGGPTAADYTLNEADRAKIAERVAIAQAASAASAKERADSPGSATLLRPVRAATDGEINGILAGLDIALKDGQSARIRNVKIKELPDKAYFCGYLNAKNSYGGYVGWRPFYGAILDAEGEPHFIVLDVDGVSRQICLKNGVMI